MVIIMMIVSVISGSFVFWFLHTTIICLFILRTKSSHMSHFKALEAHVLLSLLSLLSKSLGRILLLLNALARNVTFGFAVVAHNLLATQLSTLVFSHRTVFHPMVFASTLEATFYVSV